MGEELDELLAHYFELGVSEGAQGRSHDTEAGEAQATLELIRLRVDRAIHAARAEAFERAAQIADNSMEDWRVDRIAAAIRQAASGESGT